MGKQIVGYRADQAAIRAKEMRAIATQADREHRLVLAGDERGIYGKYPPAKL
ncbi:hypothetical protein SEA_DIRKDIRK_31 [Mycobacterium phage DirkDirk]|nr:hypothetical protein KNU85_gp031 [Mycobacterium phage DirkDirk]QGH75142.1 hypothetical protein SEA_DIRKDIRK_31 [Mycobacterium phage DirkDirk]